MSADNAVGIMDGAYFTSRSDILEFINTLLDLNLTKIEQTASGAVACQVCEYIFPGSIPMRKVNWDTKNSYEYVQNYKLLQAAFTKNRVQKYVDVDKLIRGKYQDNLEFCQWIKAFYDQQSNGVMREDYDPVAIRSKGKGGRKANDHLAGGTGGTPNRSSRDRSGPPVRKNSRTMASKKSASSSTQASAKDRNPTTKKSPRDIKQTSKAPPTTGARKNSDRSSSAPSSSKPTKSQKENIIDASNHSEDGNSPDAIIADANLMKENAELSSRNAELDLLVSEIEKERDFYFEKLRSVEVLLQVHQEQKDDVEATDYETLLQRVFKVLYATTEDNVAVDDNGKLMGEVDIVGTTSTVDGPGHQADAVDSGLSELMEDGKMDLADVLDDVMGDDDMNDPGEEMY